MEVCGEGRGGREDLEGGPGTQESGGEKVLVALKLYHPNLVVQQLWCGWLVRCGWCGACGWCGVVGVVWLVWCDVVWLMWYGWCGMVGVVWLA